MKQLLWKVGVCKTVIMIINLFLLVGHRTDVNHFKWGFFSWLAPHIWFVMFNICKCVHLKILLMCSIFRCQVKMSSFSYCFAVFFLHITDLQITEIHRAVWLKLNMHNNKNLHINSFRVVLANVFLFFLCWGVLAGW